MQSKSQAATFLQDRLAAPNRLIRLVSSDLRDSPAETRISGPEGNSMINLLLQ